MKFRARAMVVTDNLSDNFSFQIRRAVLSKNSIRFEFDVDDDEVESVVLTTHDGVSFSGVTTNCPGTEFEHRARVEAVLYSNRKGQHILVCETLDCNGDDESWFVQFYDGSPVESAMDIMST